MKSIIVTDDRSIETLASSSLLCAVKFEQTRKAAYSPSVSLAKKAARYAESLNGEGRSRKLIHVAAFDISVPQLRCAYALLHSLRSGSIRYSLFANNRLLENKYALLNTLSCAVQASLEPEPRAHCHVLWENPYADVEGEGERWHLPCALLSFIDLVRGDSITPLQRFEAAVRKRNVNLCPYFSPEGFGPVKSEPKKKRYW